MMSHDDDKSQEATRSDDVSLKPENEDTKEKSDETP
jgi:hypothetical protein